MKNSTSTPVDTIRDGSIKATIWANLGEKGTFYSVQITRTYKDDQGYHDTSSFSGSELLRVARLMNIAYDEILIRRNEDKTQRQQGAQTRADPDRHLEVVSSKARPEMDGLSLRGDERSVGHFP